MGREGLGDDWVGMSPTDWAQQFLPQKASLSGRPDRGPFSICSH